MDLIKVTESDFCTKVDEKERQQVVDAVDVQFKEMMEKHKRRTAKWYNDDGRYRSAVIEMLNMKENAMAVPKLSLVMYGEWKTKQKFLRQANRMVSKDRSRLLPAPHLSWRRSTCSSVQLNRGLQGFTHRRK